MRAKDLESLLLHIIVGSTAASVPACSPVHSTTAGSCDDYVPTTSTRLVYPDAGVVSEPVGTTLPKERCLELCSNNYAGNLVSCKIVATGLGGTAIECTVSSLCVGRRPRGCRQRRAIAATPMGRFFVEAAHLEAASVVAFRELACELRAHCAPRRLVRAAMRSARDEVRHTRAMTALARRHGGRTVAREIAPLPSRSLEDVAVQNAVEGCARETWGALVALWQGQNARDPVFRGVLARIAHDETRHAALAWEIDAWARPRLSSDARARVLDARRRAFEELETQLAHAEDDPALSQFAGLPGRAAAASLLDALRTRLAA